MIKNMAMESSLIFIMNKGETGIMMLFQALDSIFTLRKKSMKEIWLISREVVMESLFIKMGTFTLGSGSKIKEMVSDN